MPQRVVVLSPGGRFTERLLGVMADRGIRADALLIYAPSPPAAGEGGKWAASLAREALRWSRHQLRVRSRFRAGPAASRVLRTGVLNSPSMVGALAALEPDVVVLANCALLDRSVLGLPRRGCVTVHPGLLPWIRGNNPLAHALLRGVPLGCTAFWLDEGIDTGPIIERRLLPVRGGEKEAELRAALVDQWLGMTADLIHRAADARLPSGVPQRNRFPLCRTATRQELAEAAALIAEGVADRLLQQWRPLSHPVYLSLPPDLDAYPAPVETG